MSIDILRIDKLIHRNYLARIQIHFHRYRRKRPKVDASIYRLGHIRRSDASEKREVNSVSTFGRLSLWTSFESSPVSVKFIKYPEFSNSKIF